MSQIENAQRLVDRLEKAIEWPFKGEAQIIRQIFKWQFFREANETRLRNIHPGGWDEDKAYLVDPLASRISEAFADLQFGEEPDFLAGKSGDQERIEDIAFETNLPGELQHGAEIQVSEGEVWWRLRVDKDVSDWPMVEFVSRAAVYPMFRGVHPVAVAFVSVIEDGDDAWRYVEVHADGVILNRLFKIPFQQTSEGTAATNSILPLIYHADRPFGEPVPLTDRPETEDLDPVWEHECGMLAGRVINKLGKSRRVGLSQFARVEGLLFSLNEASSIGQSNMRLTARKRMTVTEAMLHPPVNPETGDPIAPKPIFNTQEEVLVEAQLDENLDGAARPQLKVMEYDFDAEAMIAWYQHLENTILVRTRTAPALVGRGVESAQTAPALRARLLDSTLAANGKARYWDDAVPDILRGLARLDELDSNQGGFGRSYEDSLDKPRMKRKSIIPEDPKDEVDKHAVAMGADLESQKTAIRAYRPDWTDAQVDEEIAEIDAENEKAAELASKFAPAQGPGIQNGNLGGDKGKARLSRPKEAAPGGGTPGITDR
jgi:hypothetical protein